MTAVARRLLDEVLALPERERADLASKLNASLAGSEEVFPEPPGEELTREEWWAAWEPEILRRAAESDAGLVPSVPWEEVKKRLGLEGNRDAGRFSS